MKIGILTLPLHTNYGGNLQAYALMTVLKEMGHEVYLINRQKNAIPLWKLPLALSKRLVKKYVFGKKDIVIFEEKRRKKEYKEISKFTQPFIERHIQPQTSVFSSSKDLSNNIRNYNFDAVIVGSDQVWRPQYTPNIEDYFLGFIKSQKLKKVAYAASFGTESWTLSDQQTRNCATYAKLFDAISVREDSAIDLCNTHFGVKAEHVLDPTMLLNAQQYKRLIKDGNEAPNNERKLLVYLLDETEDKTIVIDTVASRYSLFPFRVNSKTEEKSAPLEARIAPSTESWLKGFRDADFVITDSFHACVFSILFNKPFLVYGNEKRGLARFTSLLSLFNLGDRLITNSAMVTEHRLNSKLNWDRVSQILEIERTKSISFLNNSLKK